MKRRLMRQCFAIVAVLGCSLALAPWTAYAQTTTGTIRGTVRNAEGEAVAGASVSAVQQATNIRRNVLTSETGFFVLPGLAPGEYAVTTSMVGYAEQTQPIRVQIGQVLALNVTLTQQAIALAGIEVAATRAGMEISSPEVATNITPEQMESVPMNDRNFLSLAALAPGVTFGCQGGNCPPGDGGGISSAGGSADNANVFVDGVSFKNDILRGGVAGQDASKGNPFPQASVQEFRVITQQFKAEYPKATGAVVVATTKSGSNRWEAGAFGFRQNTDMIDQGFFALRTCRERQEQTPPIPCDPQPKQDRWQMGANVGGPIIRDKLFFFASYEGNHQDRAETVTGNVANIDQWPAEIQQEMRAEQGTFPSEFRSDLFFGKLTFTPAEQHRFELTANIRDEFDVRNFGGFNSLANAEDFNNDVRTVALKHQYNRGALLNEAQVNYQYYHWNPIQLRLDEVGRDYQGTMHLGGRCCPQSQTQNKVVLRNDVSYTVPNLAGNHVFKIGGIVDFSEYDIENPLFINPQFFFVPTNPDPLQPVRAQVGFGAPGVVVDNTQFGIYAQDDWSPTQRLILNLGVRWDVETNGLNNDYVTPPEVISELTARDDLLLINDNYFTDGGDRPAFKGAIQPRLGFTYDLSGSNTTVLFGGFGVYYDRNPFAILSGEQTRLTWKVYTIQFSEDGSVPGTVAWDDSYFSRDALEALIASGTTGNPEVFLLENDTKPPRSNHFSAGVRQAWRDVMFTVNYTGVRSYNNFTWFFANRGPDGRTFRLDNYFNVLASTDEGRAWYDGVYFKVDKPYTRDNRWGGSINYTLGWADDEFSAGRPFAGLDFNTPADFVRRRSERDQRHAVTANAIVGLPFDVRLSGILNLGSARPFRVFYGGDACVMGNLDCIGNEYPNVSVDEAIRLAEQGQAACCNHGNPFTGEPETQSFLGIGGWTYRNVDLRLEKEFEYSGHRLGLVAEGFNVFNFDNFHSYEGRIANLTPEGGVTNVNIDPETNRSRVGTPTGAITDTRLSGAPRRWQFGLRWGMVR